VGLSTEAVRRGFPGSPGSRYMHAHHPLPSLLKGCLLARLGVRRGVTHSPVKLSFSLCEQVGDLHLGSGPPCCQPPAACSRRPHHWLSSLRPSHFLCPPPLPRLSGPIWANRCFHPTVRLVPVLTCLSQCFALPHPRPTPLGPLQPPTGVGLLVYHSLASPPTAPPKG